MCRNCEHLLSARRKCCTQTDGCCAAGQFCYGTGCCNNADFGCSGSSCCPTGANCCSSGGCCGAGDVCVVVGGQNGCCPAGTTCSGAPTGCSLPGYVPCANENFCCLSGDTCFVDSSGEPGCDGVGGSSAPPASGTGTSPTSITFASPSVTFSPTSSNTAVSTGHPFTQSFPNAAPSGSQGVSNSTISATDPRISYAGASWAPNTPPCGGTSKRATTAGDSLTLQFVGTAVYLNSVTGPSAGTYTVEVDQQAASLASVDGFAPQTSGTICDFNWSSFGMEDQLHTITVTYVGASQSGESAATASFEIANFIVTTSSSGSSTGQSSSGATGVSSSNAKSTLDGNDVVLRWVLTFLTIFFSAFIL
ncbi:hypothetical protein SCHPADRAFT_999185 [Schizopora paradoxa]|uniref:Uncharacterized protein n=1 Tax=Schizopora paradoxa TaxID=27342 RepID=A0A0H2RGQ6_9AGAM|nr:hypothetical protein SCHPADRAFT_999185 [Schizopora paradoxa]